MKKSIFQGVFPPEMTLEECLIMAKNEGFLGFEVCVEPSEEYYSVILDSELISGIAKSVGVDRRRQGGIRLNSSDEELLSLKELSQSLGVRIHSVLSLLQFVFPITSKEIELRRMGVEISERLLDIAYLVGADSVLFIPGMVTPEVSYEEAYERSQEVIRYLIPKAERLNVLIAIENVWNRFLLSPLEMRSYIDSFNSKYVGVYFDVGNVLNYGYPEQWIKILGRRIQKVHLKDFSLTIGNIHGFTHLFQGDVNWRGVMRALREIGYEGFLTVEVPPYRSYPKEALKIVSFCLDLLIGSGAHDA